MSVISQVGRALAITAMVLSFGACGGNLTVGGTGKTPAVSRVIEALPEELRPALVLARDYGEGFALDGWTGNDEGHLLRRRLT